MIVLAHDGSLYGDWVARYALRFACAETDRRLLLLHVTDGRSDAAVAEIRFARLAELCAELRIDYRRELLPRGEAIGRTLRRAAPHDPQSLLVCGTRIKPRRNAFLGGSVAELLLRAPPCPVLALRVVQPGLLGLPHNLLLPLPAGEAGEHLGPVLQRLAPQLRRLYFLRAIPVNPLTQHHHSSSRRQELHHGGERDVARAAAALGDILTPLAVDVDRRVLLTSDPIHQILIEASRLKAQMILIGTGRRTLAHRVMGIEPLERILRDAPCDVGIYRGGR